MEQRAAWRFPRAIGLLGALLASAPAWGAAAEPQADVETSRRLAIAAQQRARGEQRKAQEAAQRAAHDRSPAAGYGLIANRETGAYYWGATNAAGQRDGDGVYSYKEGRCDCRFSRDSLVGAGVVAAAGGERYEGELGGGGAGAANGYGVYSWPDGRRYEGHFAADHPNGPGVLIDALGSPHGGIWKNGSLVESRQPSLAESIARTAPAAASGVSEVPLSKDGGTYTIPVVVNGSVRIPFVVDSGASDVTLPEDVVRVLLRAGTIDRRDLLGKVKYVIADGSVHYGLRLHLRELQVGDRVVRDVAASVAPERGEPLLGQTFLSRFGKWSIDNRTQRLVLAPQ